MKNVNKKKRKTQIQLFTQKATNEKSNNHTSFIAKSEHAS